MPYDLKYDASQVAGVPGGDNILDDNGYNYVTTTGATSKAGRLVASHYRLIDGIGFGNKAWTELKRASDTPQNRAILQRYIMDALKPLEESGEIRDLTVTVDDPVRLKGLGAQINFFDVRLGDTSSLGVVSPWGIE